MIQAHMFGNEKSEKNATLNSKFVIIECASCCKTFSVYLAFFFCDLFQYNFVNAGHHVYKSTQKDETRARFGDIAPK